MITEDAVAMEAVAVASMEGEVLQLTDRVGVLLLTIALFC